MPPAHCNKNDKKCDETGKKLGELAARAAGMAGGCDERNLTLAGGRPLGQAD